MKNIILMLFCFSGSITVRAQIIDSVPYTRNTNFGFLLGTNMVLKNGTNPLGITLGASMNHRITHNLWFDIQPDLTLTEYIIPDTKRTVQKSLFELPMHLVFKPGFGTLKPVFAIGPDYKFDLDDVKKSFPAADISVGIEKKFRYFYFYPELRYSYSGQLNAVYLVLNFMGGI
jgi:hypothetical protein